MLCYYVSIFLNISFGNKNCQGGGVNTKDYRFGFSDSFQNYESKKETASTQSRKFDCKTSFI